jgi:hypothetical protein
VRTQSHIEYDGCIKVELTLAADKPVLLDSLELRIAGRANAWGSNATSQPKSRWSKPTAIPVARSKGQILSAQTKCGARGTVAAALRKLRGVNRRFFRRPILPALASQ